MNRADEKRRGPPMVRRMRQDRKRLWQAILLALVIHLDGMQVLQLLPPSPPTAPNRSSPRMISLVANPQNRAKPVRVHKRTPRKKKEKKKPKDDLMKGPIVNLPPSPNNEPPPEDARFLSEHNTRTERETRSRHMRTDYRNAMNEPTRAQKAQSSNNRKAQLSAGALLGPPTPNPEGTRNAPPSTAFDIPKLRLKDRLSLQVDENIGRMSNQQSSQALEGQGEKLRLSLGTRLGVSNEHAPTGQMQSDIARELIPPMGVMSRISGAPASHHLPDVAEGEGTFLNSKQFRFASFFNRVHRDVSQNWEPLREYRKRDPTGNVYGRRARVTTLDVTLSRDGHLRNLSVVRSSGIDFLDREAISAFQKAGPFPNPPIGLLSPEGQINFQFRFHLVVSASEGIRLPF